jgi:hypothetical protein
MGGRLQSECPADIIGMRTDGGYNAWQLDAEIVRRSDDMKGFTILPRRWVGRAHLFLVRMKPATRKDVENLAETLATFVILPPSSWLSGGLPGRGSRTQQKTCWQHRMMPARKRERFRFQR